MPKAVLWFSLVLLIAAACTSAPPPPTLPTLAVLPTATDTPVPTLTASTTPSPTNTSTSTDTNTITATPTNSATLTNTPSLTPTATFTATITPTWTVSPLPTAVPTVVGNASVTMSNSRLVDLMNGPGFNYGSVQVLETGTPLFMVGRSWDNQWYQVHLLNGFAGWVYANYLVAWIDPNQLPVTWQQPTQQPMAAVTSFSLGGHVMEPTSGAFTLARRAGMSWIKLQYRYYVGQNANEIAGDIETVHKAGFRILVGLVGDKAQMGDFGSYTTSYAGFAAQVATLGADAIEIWNEPNIDREWPTGIIQGGIYTQLLAAAYTAIKAHAPSTLVISAAPAPTGFFGGDGCDTGGCNDDIFFRQMAFAGAQNYLDCVGLHHNDGIVSPLQTSGDPRGNYPTNYLLGVISRVPPAFNSKPLCFTEIGYLSPEGYGSLPGSFGWAQNTTVAEQAQWLAQAVQVARSTGRVEMMIVWNIDFTSYTSSDPMAGYAIQRHDGSCPACDMLAAAAGQ